MKVPRLPYYNGERLIISENESVDLVTSVSFA